MIDSWYCHLEEVVTWHKLRFALTKQSAEQSSRLGETGRNCDWRKRRHRGVRTTGTASALHSGAADFGQFWRIAGRPDAGQQARVRGRGALSWLGSNGVAGVQSGGTRWYRPTVRPDRRISDGLSRGSVYRRMDIGARGGVFGRNLSPESPQRSFCSPRESHGWP